MDAAYAEQRALINILFKRRTTMKKIFFCKVLLIAIVICEFLVLSGDLLA